MSPSCGCCGGCAYQASDGSEYTDGFGSLDGGWSLSFATGSSLTVSGGKLKVTLGGTTDSLSSAVYGSPLSRSASGFLSIAEVEVFEEAESSETGLFQVVSGGGSRGMSLRADWVNGRYLLGTDFDTEITQTPVDGDKLTISIENIGGTSYRLCGFINEELVGTLEGTVTGSTVSTNFTLRFIGTSTSGTAGSWDNFTYQA